MVDISKSGLENQMETVINDPAEAAIVWHSTNVPSFGIASWFSTTDLPTPTISGSDINADILSQTIRDAAVRATRVRLANVSKSSSGSNPGAGGCSYGSNGTQMASLSVTYEKGSAVDTKAVIQSTYNINAGQNVDAALIANAISEQATKLATHRGAAGQINLQSCHCSCHNDCHSNRSRR